MPRLRASRSTHATRVNTQRTWVMLSLRAAMVLFGLSPLWVPLVRPLPVLGTVAGLADSWFALQCARVPERTLLTNAVCVRCLGVYLGLVAGAALAWPRLRAPLLIVWLMFACLVMVLDVATEALDMRPPWAPLRAITGAALGYVAALLVCRASVGEAGELPGQRA